MHWIIALIAAGRVSDRRFVMVLPCAPVDSAIFWSVLCPFSRFRFLVCNFRLHHFSWGFVASQGRGVEVGFEEPHLRAML